MIDYLFDIALLSGININTQNKNINLPTVGTNLLVRPLRLQDYEKGFLNVLKELTIVGDVSEQLFINRFNLMKACAGTYYVTVIEDVSKNEVIATATLVVEQKFIHECAVRGRIEDVVVSSDYRGKELGKILILTLSALAEKLNCYKITLECKNSLIKFYESCDFKKESDNSNYLQKRLS